MCAHAVCALVHTGELLLLLRQKLLALLLSVETALAAVSVARRINRQQTFTVYC
jgi:hypothetical protein